MKMIDKFAGNCEFEVWEKAYLLEIGWTPQEVEVLGKGTRILLEKAVGALSKEGAFDFKRGWDRGRASVPFSKGRSIE